MIRQLLMFPSKCLDRVANYCFEREQFADYHHTDPIASRDDCFAIPEIILRGIAHPTDTYRDIRKLIKPVALTH